MTLHLTHEQLCDVILADSSLPQESTSAIVQEHLQACLHCSAELESLRASLSLFREASTSYANNQQFTRSLLQRGSIAPPQHILTQPLYWAAAAVLLVAASFPFSLYRQQHRPLPTATAVVAPNNAESDEALLEDVDQTLSADVPSPMEPLADPTAISISADSTTSQRKN
jgi:anti-sigma factor RsiW